MLLLNRNVHYNAETDLFDVRATDPQTRQERNYASFDTHEEALALINRSTIVTVRLLSDNYTWLVYGNAAALQPKGHELFESEDEAYAFINTL